MQDDPKALLLLAAAGAAGFFLGRATAPDGTTINVAPPSLGEEGPMPPLPPPAEYDPPLPPLGDAPPGTYARRWDELDPEIQPVALYPESADETRISPPLTIGSAAVADDCSIIALPSFWWDRAGQIAGSMVDSGVRDRDAIADEVMRSLLPGCVGAYTEATEALREHMDDKLRELLPDTMLPPPPPPPSPIIRNAPSAVRSRSRARAGHRSRSGAHRGYHPRRARSRRTLRR